MKILWRENLGIGTAHNLDAAFSFRSHFKDMDKEYPNFGCYSADMNCKKWWDMVSTHHNVHIYIMCTHTHMHHHLWCSLCINLKLLFKGYNAQKWLTNGLAQFFNQKFNQPISE